MPKVMAKEPGEMSYEELEAEIARAEGFEEENPGNSEVETPEPDTVPPVEDVDPTLESAPADEPVVDDAPVDPITAKLEAMEKAMAEMKATNEKVLGDNRNLQRLNGHLSNELGVLKRKAEEPPPEPLPTDVEMLENPVESTEKVVNATLAKAKAEQAKRAETRKASMQRTFDLVQESVPDFGDHFDGMVKILEEEGMPPDGIQAFRHNPMSVINDAPHLVHLAKRAILAKKLAEAQAALGEAKKGPQKMAADLKNAAGSMPAISSTTVRAPSKKPAAAPDFSKMSDAALEKWMKDNPMPAEEDDS